MRKALSNASIKSAHPGDVLHDESVTGLHMRVFERSRAFWFYYRTKAGVERRPKIGEFPTITLAKARDIAREWAGQVAAGKDPVFEWNSERGSITIGEMVETYLKRKGGKTAHEKRRIFEKDVLPRFKNRLAAHFTPDEAIELHRQVGRRGHYIANRTIDFLSAAYAYAIVRKKLPHDANTCTAVDRYPEHQRKRFAQPDELARIGPALARKAATRPRATAFIYLLIFSGARPQEIEDARWPMLEQVGDCGVLRLPDSKTGQARDVFLPPQAMSVIAALPRTNDTITGIAKGAARQLWNEIREEIGCPDLWMRDSRRTFGSTALSGGTELGMIGELLGHKALQTTMRYAKLVEGSAHKTAAAVAAAIQERLTAGSEQSAAEPGAERE